MVHYFIRQKDFRIFLLIMLLMALNWSIDVLRIQQNTQKIPYILFYFSQWLGNKIDCIEICSKSIDEYTRAQKKIGNKVVYSFVYDFEKNMKSQKKKIM